LYEARDAGRPRVEAGHASRWARQHAREDRPEGLIYGFLLYIDPAFFPQIFAQDLSPKKAAELNAGQIPINAAILGSPSGPVGWHAIRSWYAVSGADLVIDPAEQHWMASRAGAITVQFDDASHAGGFTHYAARFVKLVEEAAGETAG
jgi:hypothetical protein